jgi:hypothetical protein
MVELADEFVEDPHCRLVLMASDREGAVIISEAEMVDEVETGLAGLDVEGVRLRRLSVVDSRDPARMS